MFLKKKPINKPVWTILTGSQRTVDCGFQEIQDTYHLCLFNVKSCIRINSLLIRQQKAYCSKRRSTYKKSADNAERFTFSCRECKSDTKAILLEFGQAINTPAILESSGKSRRVITMAF